MMLYTDVRCPLYHKHAIRVYVYVHAHTTSRRVPFGFNCTTIDRPLLTCRILAIECCDVTVDFFFDSNKLEDHFF